SIALEGSGLVYSSLKPAHIGSPTVLRCYNATGRKTAGAWRFAQGVKTAHRVRADEREAVALVLEQRGNVVRFVAEPHEIVSLLVTLCRSTIFRPAGPRTTSRWDTRATRGSCGSCVTAT